MRCLAVEKGAHDGMLALPELFRRAEFHQTALVVQADAVCDGEGEFVHTVWVLVRQWEDEARTRPTGTWNAFLTNSDVFRRS